MSVTFLTNEDKGEMILNTAQSLTEEQKAQARENIGTVSKTVVENTLLMRMYFESNASDAHFEGVPGTGVYIKIPGMWWLRGRFGRDSAYSTICVDNRATSPSGVEDCIFLGHNKTLVFNKETVVYEIVNTIEVELYQIPIFSVGRCGSSEVVSGGVGAYYYESYKNLMEFGTSVGTSESVLPSVFESQYAVAKETIQSNQLQAGKDGVTFIWLTDLHWQNNWRNSPQIVKHIVKDMGIRNIVLTGDYIGGGDHDTNIALLRDCVESFSVDNAKTFAITGNHDYNTIGATDNTHYFSHNETEALVMGGVDDKVVSGNGCYYYYDMQKNRTRLVFLDTGLEQSSGHATMDSEQLSWFNNALATTPDGYRILVFQHIIYGSTEWSTPLLDKLFLSYQGEAVITACDTHNAKGGTQVVAIFGGHIHMDYNTTSPAGIPIIMMDSDSKQTYSGVTSSMNTANSQCVNVVTVDYKNNGISCVRIGRGSDLVISDNE